MKKVLLSIALFSLVTSCMVTKTPIGEFKEAEGKVKTYSKQKQLYVLWGLIPIGRATANTPNEMPYQVVTKYNLGDVVVTYLTGGLFMTYTIKVEVKKLKGEK